MPGGDSLVEHLGMASPLELHDCDDLGILNLLIFLISNLYVSVNFCQTFE